MDEEVMNLVRRGEIGWTKVGLIVRDDLINERKSMMTGEFEFELVRLVMISFLYPTLHLRTPRDLARAGPSGTLVSFRCGR